MPGAARALRSKIRPCKQIATQYIFDCKEMLLRSVILVTLPLAIHCQPVRIVIDPNPVHMSPPLTVPAEVLRYPLSEHARGMLQKALQLSDRGDHAAAAHQLLRTVAKFPDSAAYVYSLLGVEYLKTSQF